MNKWVKRLLIIGIIAVLTIFFGSIVFSLMAYLTDFMGILMGWISKALRWLAKLVDIFGFTGLFIANADNAHLAQIIQNTTKVFIGG